MIKAIIFDWDGTLHDTTHLYGSAFRTGCRWLKENGYGGRDDYTDEEAAQYIGYSAKETWRLFRPDLPDEVTDIPNRIVAETMVTDIENDKAVLYPGALDVLGQLKKEDYFLVFLSNCRISYMEAHRAYFHLDKYFDRMYNCEAFGWAGKPEIFNMVKDDLPEGYVMIGDRASDLEVAIKGGFPSIGCSYGFGFEGELKSADLIADNVIQIPKLVKELNM